MTPHWLTWLLLAAAVINNAAAIWHYLQVRQYRRLNAMLLALCVDAFEVRGFPLLRILGVEALVQRR